MTYDSRSQHSAVKGSLGGIFLNDERPDLTSWATDKFGTAAPSQHPPIPENVPNLNHVFYGRVFELILRLKANYPWPAMWNNCFNEDDSANPGLADRYGVVVGWVAAARVSVNTSPGSLIPTHCVGIHTRGGSAGRCTPGHGYLAPRAHDAGEAGVRHALQADAWSMELHEGAREGDMSSVATLAIIPVEHVFCGRWCARRWGSMGGCYSVAVERAVVFE